MAAKLEAEKFSGKNDYGLWKLKMRAVLVQQGLSAALTSAEADGKAKGPVMDDKAQAKFDEMQMKAHSAVILCLGDKVLREVQGETTAAGILKKLDEVYLAKSLANRLYMKRRLYSYSFSDDKSIVEQLEDFCKAVDDLEAVDVKMKDEDKAILVLNALPSSYDQLRDAILYGRESPIMRSIQHSWPRSSRIVARGRHNHRLSPSMSRNGIRKNFQRSSRNLSLKHLDQKKQDLVIGARSLAI